MTANFRFRLYSFNEFHSLAEAAGFVPIHLSGDYSYASYEPNDSPFMIWILRGS